MSYTTLRSQAHRIGTVFGGMALASAEAVSAQVYNGGGAVAGLAATSGLQGIPRDDDPRAIIINIITSVLSFMALIAVTTVIIAGIYLIVGMGSDDSKDKAKKIIQYTLIGLLVILFSRVIVGLVTNYLANQIA